MAELQIRIPYTAWGEGREWEDAYEQVMDDLFQAVEAADIGDVDDADHFEEFICFYLLGEEVDELSRVARVVLMQHGLLEFASAMVTDPDADDMDVGVPIAL